MERFLEKEPQLRKELGWEPGTYYLLLPFHIYYIDRFVKLLQELQPFIGKLKEAGIRLLITCGATAYRRGMYEKDIIVEGLKKWLPRDMPIPILSGGSILEWVWLAEALLLPYPHSMKKNLEGMGMRVLGLGEMKQLDNLMLGVRPQEAVAWLLKGERDEG